MQGRRLAEQAASLNNGYNQGVPAYFNNGQGHQNVGGRGQQNVGGRGQQRGGGYGQQHGGFQNPGPRPGRGNQGRDYRHHPYNN